jgi:signal transduction histidine kinase
MKIISKESGQKTEYSKPPVKPIPIVKPVEPNKQKKPQAEANAPKKVTSKKEDGLSSDAKRVVVNKSSVANQVSKPTKKSTSKKVKRSKSEISAEKRIVHDPDKPSYFSTTYDRFISLIRFNITFKLTLGYAIRLILLIAFLFFFIYVSFSYYLFYNAQENMKNDRIYLESLLVNTQDYKSDTISAYLTQNDLQLYVFDKDQVSLFATREDNTTYLEASSVSEYDFRNFPSFPSLFETGSLIFDDNTLIYYALKTDMIEHTNTLESTFPIGFVLCIVLILSSIRSASKMANKHLKPIKIMTEQVKDMSGNNLSTRLNVSGTKDELKDLALTFNQMLNDIQKSYEREKQFVSDASHELRTPIAVIKGYAGMLNRWGKDDPAILEESIHAILSETDNMHSLVESLLFIARNDKGALKMDKVPFSFTELFAEIVKETRLIDSQHEITETIDQNLLIHGSSDKLKQALRIFIDNSIKYTPDGGKLTLSLRRSEHHAIVVISDDGIGISKEDLPHIFDRFYRADKSRTKMKENQHGGTGLGLSIAKIIIEQHGGKIHVDSAIDEGTTFTLFLPALKPTESSEINDVEEPIGNHASGEPTVSDTQAS